MQSSSKMPPVPPVMHLVQWKILKWPKHHHEFLVYTVGLHFVLYESSNHEWTNFKGEG